MGIYLNPGNASFQSIRKGIYIDKSELISFVNARLGTKEKLICAVMQCGDVPDSSDAVWLVHRIQ